MPTNFNSNSKPASSASQTNDGPVQNQNANTNAQLSDLIELVAQLRGKNGCPWDIEQTHESLIPYLIEEAYELAEVLRENPRQDWKISDELGDCLYQVVIHAQIASETGRFDMSDVIEKISQKLKRRHPHVFGGLGPWPKEKVLSEWSRIKQEEKKLQPVDLHPKLKDPFFKQELYWTGLEDAHHIGVKAESYRFDWSSWEDVLKKVREELEEVQEACETTDHDHLTEEIGDLLFAISQLARVKKINPEHALKSANQKFRTRFQAMILKLKANDPQKSDQELIEVFKNLTSQQKEDLWTSIKSKN